MMKQKTFTEEEYERRGNLSRRDKFLKQMDKILPWTDWMEMISPHYPKGRNGRPVRGIETMLRMYLLQIWFGMSDVGTEEAIQDSISMRNFMKLGFGERVPDATTLLKFRHLLERHEIAKQMFEDIRNRLERNGLMMRGGTIVDATIIEAPNSTKNRKQERDPEMSSTKKGANWHFGMKVHSAVDAATGYVRKIVATTASESDISQAHKLIAEDDRVVYGDSGYVGIEKREEIRKLAQPIDFRIVSRPKAIRERYKRYRGYKWDRAIERRKSEIRSFVEHPFLYVKRRFRKTMYRGIAKNLNRLYMLFAFSNVMMCAKSENAWAISGCR